MPIVDVAYTSNITEPQLRTLTSILPQAVSLAVQCPEEPYDGHLRPGDVELCFRQRSSYDESSIDILIDVRSKWFASRAADRDERCARLRDVVAEAMAQGSVGVYLSLPVAGWAQSD